MPFYIVQQNITKMKVDAIVNAANTSLQMGGGVCEVIFQKAGIRKMRAACDKLAPIHTGQAVITPGFHLPAKYVIHAAGPEYDLSNQPHYRELLHSAYTESLELAEKHRCKSIAFPLISSGIYGYPKDEALEVARHAIEEFLDGHDMEVYLAVFEKTAFVLGQALLGEIENYIARHYGDSSRRNVGFSRFYEVGPLRPSERKWLGIKDTLHLDQLFENLDEPFSEKLLKLIDKKGKTDVEVYRSANIDRKLFSKIRRGHGYTPKKPTILALAVALELTISETDDLLERAGYALSHASKFDVIVEYFIINERYDIHEINEVLFYYDQPLLGMQG